MRNASLILPLFDNDSRSLADLHTDLRRDLLDAFGGFTASDVTGAWRDESSGLEYVDDSIRYDVARDWAPRDVALLTDIAESYCGAARQLALCMIDPNGQVAFVHPPKAPAQGYGAALVGAVRKLALAEEAETLTPYERRANGKARQKTRAAERAFKYAFRDQDAA